MFSQYSWWDFAKFILALAVPYYAFVLWKYYRQDIVEWFTNRGQAPSAPVTQPVDEEEDDESNLFTATNYIAQAPVATSPSSVSQPTPGMTRTEPVPTQPAVKPKEADLPDGVVLNDEGVSSFDMPLPVEVIRPEEELLEEVVATAKTLVVDREGNVQAQNTDDEKALRLAAAINQQNGNSVFGGMAFNR